MNKHPLYNSDQHRQGRRINKRSLALLSAALISVYTLLAWSQPINSPLAILAADDKRLYYKGEVVADEVYYDMPHYRQQDPAWGEEIMYPFNGSIALYGCAVTALSMVVDFFEIDLNPSEMNKRLDLYAAPLEWEAYTAAEGLTIKRKDSTLDAQTQLLDRAYVKHETIRELSAGYPVILGIQHNVHHTTHFVVANGYSYVDGEYIVHILDPSYNNDYQTIDDIDAAWEYMRLLVITD